MITNEQYKAAILEKTAADRFALAWSGLATRSDREGRGERLTGYCVGRCIASGKRRDMASRIMRLAFGGLQSRRDWSGGRWYTIAASGGRFIEAAGISQAEASRRVCDFV